MAASFPGVREEDLGWVTGVIAGAYCFGQLFSNYLWGHASDKFGAKYVVMFSLFCSAFSIMGFGLSTRLWMAAACRMFSGMMNGNCTVVKSYMGRITDTSNQKVGVSVILVSFGAGASMAQLLGGVLASPHKNFPDYFGEDSIFVMFPYFLPCLIVGVYDLFTVMMCGFFLQSADRVQQQVRESQISLYEANREETEQGTIYENHIQMRSICSDDHQNGGQYQRLPVHDENNKDDELNEDTNERDEETSRRKQEQDEKDEDIDDLNLKGIFSEDYDMLEPMGFRRNMVVTALAYGWSAFTYMMIDEVIPLFFKMDVARGGLHYSPKYVGVQMSIYGLFRVMWMILVIPFSLPRMGLRFSYLFSYVLLVPCILSFPLLNYIAVSEGTGDSWLVWICFIIEQGLRSLCSAHAFSALILLVTNAVPETHMGKAHGLGQSLAAFGRTIGPVLSGSLLSVFYYKLNSWPLHEWYLWIFLSIFCLISALVSLMFEPSLEETYRDREMSRQNSRMSLLGSCSSAALIADDERYMEEESYRKPTAFLSREKSNPSSDDAQGGD
eukprot:Nk52_evm19s539 gene=Nk52_evmTU19s539